MMQLDLEQMRLFTKLPDSSHTVTTLFELTRHIESTVLLVVLRPRAKIILNVGRTPTFLRV